MEEINLLQNRVKDTTKAWERQIHYSITILSVVLILLLGGAATLFLLNKNLQKQVDEISSKNQSISQTLTDTQKSLGPAKAFQAQLANVKLLLNNHTYISPLLSELSKVSYSKVQYTTVDVADSGLVHVEGRVDSYQALGQVILGLSTSSKFQNIKLLSVVPSTGKINGYIFAIDLKAVPAIFTKQ